MRSTAVEPHEQPMTRVQRLLMTADPIGGVWTYALALAQALQPFNIEIALVTGRTLAAKRAAYAAIARNIQTAFGIEASDLRIVLEEVDLENWGINGRPASEL